MAQHRNLTRRDFLGRSAASAAYVGMMAAVPPVPARLLRADQERFPVVASEPWGRLVRVAEGAWALISDPLTDRTTLCNGGIVAGRSGVVMIEAFGSDDGARWMTEQARRLTGRPPTHVLLTHYHGDHTGGLRGAKAAPEVVVLATDMTRSATSGNPNAPAEILDTVELLDEGRPTEIDLGDRVVSLVPRSGHTGSDVTLEISDPSVVFCGDLVWNGMFPNYVDAVPSRLTRSVRSLRRDEPTTYVPGHGSMADGRAVTAYIDLLGDVESAARRAIQQGMTSGEAGAAYRLPVGLEEWTLFNPAYFSRAIGAWMKEVAGA